ncbi:MAG: PLDc N-terminal domain-containing protein, partial [Desulfosarcina sp.]|nr:PLDc N-terminal domain-containing protein [Desulfobacterales bacterium]
MSQDPFTGTLFLALHVLIQIALIVRVLLRPHREPASRIAWIVVIITFPVLGILAYILLGETNIGRRRVERVREVLSRLPDVADAAGADATNLKVNFPQRYAHLFQMGKSINGFDPVGGNRAQLMQDSNATIASIVADIDAAKDHIHLLFYIWLPDNNGCKVAEALKRAAARGVTCRAMADGVGSHVMINSEHWQAMREAGIRLAGALPIGNPLLRPLKGRVDLRNHRKIVVIDNHITYCGSQNCADPEFLVKAKYAPWVDAMMRFEGPIARQNQYLFAGDWEAETGENISDLLKHPIPPTQPGLPAQVIGTGPTVRYSAMPEMFESLMYAVSSGMGGKPGLGRLVVSQEHVSA